MVETKASLYHLGCSFSNDIRYEMYIHASTVGRGPSQDTHTPSHSLMGSVKHLHHLNVRVFRPDISGVRVEKPTQTREDHKSSTTEGLSRELAFSLGVNWHTVITFTCCSPKAQECNLYSPWKWSCGPEMRSKVQLFHRPTDLGSVCKVYAKCIFYHRYMEMPHILSN